MYRIVAKRILAPTLKLIEVEAPAVARKVQAGQFVMVRIAENGERVFRIGRVVEGTRRTTIVGVEL